MEAMNRKQLKLTVNNRKTRKSDGKTKVKSDLEDVKISHSNKNHDGEKLKNIIKNGHDNINSIHLLDMGCALGVHAGPGSLAIAIQSSS